MGSQSQTRLSNFHFHKKRLGHRHTHSESPSVVSDSLRPNGLYSLWNSPGQSTGVGSLSLLQGSSQPRDWTQVSLIADGFFTSWATREAQEYWHGWPSPAPADLPDPEIELGSPALQADSLPTELSGKPDYDIPYMWTLKRNDTNELTYKTITDSQT